MNQDREHLKILSIFYYVLGGITALFSCIPLIHLTIGLSCLISPRLMTSGSNPPPAIFGWLFTIIPLIIIFLGWCCAGGLVYAGICISQLKHYLFCIIMAGIACTFAPLGTVLGIFTIIVLMRPAVKDMFLSNQDCNINNPEIY